MKNDMQNEPILSSDERVIRSILKLSRAMRRCPPDPGKLPLPPALSRLLECIGANDGISSRDLCEILDLRPSSLSGFLARAEQEGWIVRTQDTEDRRMQRVTLSEKGKAAIADLKKAREEDAAKKTGCLSDSEKETFCDLCDRLSSHMESLAPERPRHGRPCGPHGPGFPRGPEGRHGFPGPDCFPGPEGCPGPNGFHDPDGSPEPEDVPEGADAQDASSRGPGRPGFPPGTRFRC